MRSHASFSAPIFSTPGTFSSCLLNFHPNGECILDGFSKYVVRKFRETISHCLGSWIFGNTQPGHAHPLQWACPGHLVSHTRESHKCSFPRGFICISLTFLNSLNFHWAEVRISPFIFNFSADPGVWSFPGSFFFFDILGFHHDGPVLPCESMAFFHFLGAW